MICAPSAVDGPLLATVTVYVVDVPGTTEVTPSVFVTDRSTNGVRVSTSLAVLSDVSGSSTPTGAITVAVLATVPLAVPAIVALSV